MVLKVKLVNYTKELMQDLQDMFSYLRDAVTAIPDSATKEQLLFYIDKIIDQQNMRNFKSIQGLLDIISELTKQEDVKQEIRDVVVQIQDTFVELCSCFEKR